MKTDTVHVAETIEKAKAAIKADKNMADSTKVTFEALIELVTLLSNRLGLNSSNSSKPPSSDPNAKKGNRQPSNRPPGGQPGHKGTTLTPVKDPDIIKDLPIDKRTLPRGKQYTPDGYVSRQVVDLKISKIITEYRAQILVDEEGQQYVAEFPTGVKRPIQYGASIKAHAAYLSVYQLIPYHRIKEQFEQEYKIPLSTGTLFNMKVEASERLVNLVATMRVNRELSPLTEETIPAAG